MQKERKDRRAVEEDSGRMDLSSTHKPRVTVQVERRMRLSKKDTWQVQPQRTRGTGRLLKVCPLHWLQFYLLNTAPGPEESELLRKLPICQPQGKQQALEGKTQGS